MRHLRGNPAAPIKKLAADLGRTEASVKQKRHEIGLGGGRRWSEADTKFLRENPRMPVREVARRLGRHENSVHNKRRAMGIRSHEWTAEEDKIVRMCHGRLKAGEIAAKLPGRTAMAVSIRARQMGLRSGVFWKPSEIEFLKANPRMGTAEAARELGKTAHAVQHKRRSLGMTRRTVRKGWTEDDKALLLRLTRDGATAREIAARTGRTKASVDVMRGKMGIGTPRSERALQPGEEQFLRENPRMSAVEIAKHVGRTPGAVRRWRRKIGLPRYQKHERWTVEETELLKANLQRPLGELYAMFPGRPRASVNAKAGSLGRMRLQHKGHTYRNGYKYIQLPGGGKIEEHRQVAEMKIGRPLRQKEVVHHVNYVKHDNRPANLDVLESNAAHTRVIPRSVNGMARGLLELGSVGYDRDAHSYFLPSGSFGPGGGRVAAAPRRAVPSHSYVFCGAQTFPFSLQPDRRLADTLRAMPYAGCMLPLEGRHAVALCGASASPARLERGLGASASPFPVVKGSLADHSVAPIGGSVGAGGIVEDTVVSSAGAAATVRVALLDSRQLGALDACARRGSLCDLVEVPSPVEFESGEGLSVAHVYVPREGARPIPGSSTMPGPPPRLFQVFQPLVRPRARRGA